MEGNLKAKLSEVNSRAVPRGQNELVGKFKISFLILCFSYFGTFLSTWPDYLIKKFSLNPVVGGILVPTKNKLHDLIVVCC